MREWRPELERENTFYSERTHSIVREHIPIHIERVAARAREREYMRGKMRKKETGREIERQRERKRNKEREGKRDTERFGGRQKERERASARARARGHSLKVDWNVFSYYRMCSLPTECVLLL